MEYNLYGGAYLFIHYRLQEAGILEKWFEDICGKAEWDYVKVLFKTSSDLQNKEPHTLTLYNLSGAFLVLGVGIILSAIGFFIEFGVHHWSN